jgi:heme-degrading monooxygenase HmoA
VAAREQDMIARMWHGMVPKAKASEYLDYMRTVAIPDYRSIPGNRGAWSLHREDGDVVHFQMLSFWDDIEAIKAFAGEDFKLAKYYDFDREFLIELEPHVLHYELHGD